MIIAKVTSKGQITIPDEILRRLGVYPGKEEGFEEWEAIYRKLRFRRLSLRYQRIFLKDTICQIFK